MRPPAAAMPRRGPPRLLKAQQNRIKSRWNLRSLLAHRGLPYSLTDHVGKENLGLECRNTSACFSDPRRGKWLHVLLLCKVHYFFPSGGGAPLIYVEPWERVFFCNFFFLLLIIFSFFVFILYLSCSSYLKLLCYSCSSFSTSCLLMSFYPFLLLFIYFFLKNHLLVFNIPTFVIFIVLQ